MGPAVASTLFKNGSPLLSLAASPDSAVAADALAAEAASSATEEQGSGTAACCCAAAGRDGGSKGGRRRAWGGQLWMWAAGQQRVPAAPTNMGMAALQQQLTLWHGGCLLRAT